MKRADISELLSGQEYGKPKGIVNQQDMEKLLYLILFLIKNMNL